MYRWRRRSVEAQLVLIICNGQLRAVEEVRNNGGEESVVTNQHHRSSTSLQHFLHLLDSFYRPLLPFHLFSFPFIPNSTFRYSDADRPTDRPTLFCLPYIHLPLSSPTKLEHLVFVLTSNCCRLSLLLIQFLLDMALT